MNTQSCAYERLIEAIKDWRVTNHETLRDAALAQDRMLVESANYWDAGCPMPQSMIAENESLRAENARLKAQIEALRDEAYQHIDGGYMGRGK